MKHKYIVIFFILSYLMHTNYTRPMSKKIMHALAVRKVSNKKISTLCKKDIYNPLRYEKISSVWNGLVHEKILPYYSIKKAVDAAYLCQNTYFKALGIGGENFYEIYADCLFLEGIFYIMDKKTEEPGTDQHNLTQKIQEDVDFMINWLKMTNHYTKSIETHLYAGIDYWKKEKIYMHKTPNIDECHQLLREKSFDIRTIGCMVTKFFKGLDEPTEEMRIIIDEIWWYAEGVMDILDLKKDVEQNALNIYKFYCRWYGPEQGKEVLWTELQNSKKRALKLIYNINNEQVKNNLLAAGNLWWNQLSKLEMPNMIPDPFFTENF